MRNQILTEICFGKSQMASKGGQTLGMRHKNHCEYGSQCMLSQSGKAVKKLRTCEVVESKQYSAANVANVRLPQDCRYIKLK